MHRIEVNILTGEKTVIALTPEEIAALPPPPPLPPRRIAKADIWRRVTDAEAVSLDALLNAQPVRLRRMWEDAQYLSTDDELYPQVEAALVGLFGASRTAELLA